MLYLVTVLNVVWGEKTNMATGLVWKDKIFESQFYHCEFESGTLPPYAPV